MCQFHHQNPLTQYSQSYYPTFAIDFRSWMSQGYFEEGCIGHNDQVAHSQSQHYSHQGI